MYVPQNMTLVVTGASVHPSDLLDTVAKETLPDLVKAGHGLGPKPAGFVRPFVESSSASNPPMLERDVVKTVTYAE